MANGINGNGEYKEGIYQTKPMYSGAYHCVNNIMFEPKRTNHFELQILQLGDLDAMDSANSSSTGSNASGNIANRLGTNTSTSIYGNLGGTTPSDSSQYLTLSVNSFAAPDLSLSNVPISYGNSKVFYAGVASFGNGSTIDFNDFIGIETEKILCAWFNQAYNIKDETIGFATQYKKTAYLIEYAPNGTQVAVWELDGCWLTSIKLGTFKNDGTAEVRKITGTMIYDRCIPVYNNTTSS